jgi:hypothetical protein
MLETPLCCESGYPQVICSSPSAICVHSPSRRCGEGPEMPRDIQSQPFTAQAAEIHCRESSRLLARLEHRLCE